jgi:hypothetical protein
MHLDTGVEVLCFQCSCGNKYFRDGCDSKRARLVREIGTAPSGRCSEKIAPPEHQMPTARKAKRDRDKDLVAVGQKLVDGVATAMTASHCWGVLPWVPVCWPSGVSLEVSPATF